MNKYPLIKIAVAFIIGILLSKFLSISISFLFVISFSLIFLTVGFAFFKFSKVASILVYLLISLSGITYSEIRNLEKAVYPFEDPKISKSIIFSEIIDIDLHQNDKISFKVVVDSILIKDQAREINSVLYVRVFDKNLNSLYNKISIGNKIFVTGTLQKGRETRNPGEFNYQKYLESEGISGLFNVYKKSDVKILQNDISFFKQTIFEIRKSIDEQLEKLHTKQAYSLLRGLILADRKLIDYETREDFINSGVVHVLAVSGLHVGYILLIFLFLFNRTNIIVRIFLTIFGLIAFLLLTNSPPSVFRATIMTVVALSAFLANREYNGINALAIASLIILLISPNDLFSPGFQLSFSAVAAILIIYPKFSKNIGNLKIGSVSKKILLFASVSLAAQIGTLPFTLFYFGKLSIVALFANLFVIPAIGMILPLGFLTLFTNSFFPWLGVIYASANNIFILSLFWLINIFSKIPLAFIDIVNFSIYDGIIFYLLIGFFFSGLFLKVRIIPKLILTGLIILNFFLYTKLDNKSIIKENMLSIIYIDVDQGDSFLLYFPNGKTALIDAGNSTKYFDTGKNIILPLMRQLNIEKINYAFISHIDADHYLGIHYLIENNLVDTVYKPPTDVNVKKEKTFYEFLQEHKIPFIDYHKEIKMIGNTAIYILNDSTDSRTDRFDSNNKSGSLKIVYGNNSFLFTGDSEIPAERFLVSKFGNFLDSDVLKLGHHGSKTSSSEIFLNTVTPDAGIISAGIKNKFKHPSEIILERLKSRNIQYRRTDLDGAVIIQSDGENYKFIDWRNFDTFTLSN